MAVARSRGRGRGRAGASAGAWSAPLLLCARALGLVAGAVRRDAHRPHRPRLRASRAAAARTALCAALAVACSAYNLAARGRKLLRWDSALAIILNSSLLSHAVLLLGLYGSAFWKRAADARVVGVMEDLRDRVAHALGGPRAPLPSASRWKQLRYIAAVLLCTLCSAAMLSNHLSRVRGFLVFKASCAFLGMVVVGVLVGLFAVFTSDLQYLFETVNAHLQSMTRGVPVTPSSVRYSTKQRSILPRPLWNLLGETKEPFDAGKPLDAGKPFDAEFTNVNLDVNGSPLVRACDARRTHWSAADVREIASIHSALCDAAESLEAAFSSRLLFVVMHTFFPITYGAYVTIRVFMGITTICWFFASITTYTLISMAFFGYHLLRIINCCAAVAKEANKSGALVHNLLLSSKDPLVRHELQLLSLQLLHRRVRFSACGFFPLDFSLLYSIVGAVTTYLVILIQIQLSIGSNKQK